MREIPRAGMPSLVEQLAVLPPLVKVVAGAVMIAMGAAAVVMSPGSAYSWVLLAIAALIGVPLKWHGVVEGIEQRREASEMVRARQELPALRDALARLRAEKRGVERCLIERGYTSRKVRRWIARECDVALPQSGRA